MNKNIILYTGHLYEWKGVDTLAQAANFLDKENLIYFVGGTDSDRIDFQKKYPSKNIITVPFQNRIKIALWLKAADVLVLPNIPNSALSERHTSPIKMFEYMASGTPIIASNLPSLKEILKTETSFFFQAGDVNSLINALKKVLINKNVAGKKAQKAKQDALRYTWKQRSLAISNHLLIN